MHSDSHTIGAVLKKDALRIFEKLREDKAIGRKLTSEQAAWVTYFLLIRKFYPKIYQKFATSVGLDDIKTLRSAFSIFVRQYKPKFKHLIEIDRKYEDYDFSEIARQLFGIRKGYWPDVSFEMFPLAIEDVQNREFLMKQAYDISELTGRAALRTALYVKHNNLKFSDYSLMAGLFFQACLDAVSIKIFMPKPAKDWITYGIPERSFYQHLEGLKKTFPDEAKTVVAVEKLLPTLWKVHRTSSEMYVAPVK